MSYLKDSARITGELWPQAATCPAWPVQRFPRECPHQSTGSFHEHGSRRGCSRWPRTQESTMEKRVGHMYLLAWPHGWRARSIKARSRRAAGSFGCWQRTSCTRLSGPLSWLRRLTFTWRLVSSSRARIGRVEGGQVAGDIGLVVGIDNGNGLAPAIAFDSAVVKGDLIEAIGLPNLAGTEPARLSRSAGRQHPPGGYPMRTRSSDNGTHVGKGCE